MSWGIIDKIIEELKNATKEKQGSILLENKTIPLSKDNFHILNKTASSRKIAYIDGGNAEILGGADFSLHFIRAYAAIFKGNKTIDRIKSEFYVLTNAVADKSRIIYKAKIFSLSSSSADEISFDSEDETLRDGLNRADVGKIGSIIRRFAELLLAKKAISMLEKGDIIVLDGSLKCNVPGESEHMQNLYSKGIEKGIIISSLNKTSRIFTDKGGCFLSQLTNLTNLPAWYYSPPIELDNNKHQACISFTKLNKSSSYVFSIEVCKKQKEHLKNIAEELASNSNDAVFPGYPYGLILADRFARVSNEEKEHLATIFQAKAGREWNFLKKHLNALNAHSILDDMQ